MMYLTSFSHYALLAIGLGFVVFFHELGHFLAAKYSDVYVEQFALGFGPAIVAWRKGIGLRRGTTAPEADRRIDARIKGGSADEDSPLPTQAQIAKARTELGLGETEYRLNWFPLGGYVKMLGQDDMDPTAVSDDPRSYNKKPIRQRMLIISAGVLMNVLLAAIGFMIVYLIGFKSSPAEVGGVLNDSPASHAVRADGARQPLQVGDRILYFNGHYQHDFASVQLTVALARPNQPLAMVVQHTDGSEETLYVTPTRTDPNATMLAIGVLPARELSGPDKSEADEVEKDLSDPKLVGDDLRAIKPGDVIAAIDGQTAPPAVMESAEHPVPGQYWRLVHALNADDFSPISLTLRDADGKERQVDIQRHFQEVFSPNSELNFAGMAPRVRVDGLEDDQHKSPVYGVVYPGDVITAVTTSDGKTVANPTSTELRELLNAAGQAQKKVTISLLDPDGAPRTCPPVVPNFELSNDRRGLGVGLGVDELHTVVANVAEDSSAARAGIKPGWTITQIDGQPAGNWFHVRRLIAQATPGQSMAVGADTPSGPAMVHLTVTKDDIDDARSVTLTTDIYSLLHDRTEIRKTSNPITAAVWGIAETRDFILQFYVTLHRMIFERSVSYKEAMGPVGIVKFGAASAARGPDWLLWFLAMISANLAVVNFLPVPVMDGGLFVLLILESIQGRPLSLKTQQMIQLVGLAMILTLFLLVTYQDITRQIGHG